MENRDLVAFPDHIVTCLRQVGYLGDQREPTGESK
jgi:hypothetical protein